MMPQIDSEVVIDSEGTLAVVIDVTDTEAIFRLDINGKDASSIGGEEGIDWEYVYIPFVDLP